MAFEQYKGISLFVLLMTIIDLSTDIPNNINTLERLAAWAILALARTNPTLKILETSSTEPERVAQSALIRADDDSLRLIARASLEIDPAYSEDNTIKFWMHVQELSNTALPDAFKQN